MPPFRRVVQALGEAWVNERAQVLAQADALVGAVRKELSLAETMSEAATAAAATSGGGADGQSDPLFGAAATKSLDPEAALSHVVTGLAAGFDPEWGGFGPAPKFPRPTLVELCLRRARPRGADADQARQMALRTLDAMAAGGIYDHLVGGFCRYSTDAHWLVPHFEKMLTDQALLARAYLHAWQDTGQRDYLGVVTETLDFVLARSVDARRSAVLVLRRRRRRGGGRACNLHPRRVASAAARASSSGRRRSGTGSPNRATGRGAPSPCAPSVHPSGALPRWKRPVPCWRRPGRNGVQPARDEKVLTEWNAMTASTLAEVASATGIDHYGRRAEEIVDFLWESMYSDGRLMRSWQGGRARHLAVAADYAWLADACTRLSEWSGRALWRGRALHASAQLVDLFWDDDVGRLLHDGQRRGIPGRPAQGVSRRRGPGHQLHRGRRAAPRQRPWRRTAARRVRRTHHRAGSTAHRPAPGRARRPGRGPAHVEPAP